VGLPLQNEERGKFAGNFLFDQSAEYLPRGNQQAIASFPISPDVHKSDHPTFANLRNLKRRCETVTVQIPIILSTVNLRPFLS
jgi:hypothetical protein